MSLSFHLWRLESSKTTVPQGCFKIKNDQGETGDCVTKLQATGFVLNSQEHTELSSSPIWSYYRFLKWKVKSHTPPFCFFSNFYQESPSPEWLLPEFSQIKFPLTQANLSGPPRLDTVLRSWFFLVLQEAAVCLEFYRVCLPPDPHQEALFIRSITWASCLLMLLSIRNSVCVWWLGDSIFHSNQCSDYSSHQWDWVEGQWDGSAQ